MGVFDHLRPMTMRVCINETLWRRNRLVTWLLVDTGQYNKSNNKLTDKQQDDIHLEFFFSTSFALLIRILLIETRSRTGQPADNQ